MGDQIRLFGNEWDVDKGMKADRVHLRERESFQQPDIHENDSPTPNVRPSVAFLLGGMPLLCIIAIIDLYLNVLIRETVKNVLADFVR